MKLAGRDAAAFCARPDPAMIGALLFGEDAGLILDMRQQLVAALLGEGDDPLRLDQFEASALMRDAATLDGALRARGFFPGRRVVLVSGATDGFAQVLGKVLDGITAEDAFLVVTAGELRFRSALRTVFEGPRTLAALELRETPPDGAEIERRLAAAGARCGLTPEAAVQLADLAQEMDHGAFRNFLEVVALYGLDRTEPLGADEVALLMPHGLDTELDRLVDAMGDGRAERVGPLMSRLAAAGATPVSMVLAAERHFRAALGVLAGAALRMPPARRDPVQRHARAWGGPRLESANRLLFETDRRLRSAGDRPDLALVERTFLRLAMMAPKG